jgi:hypothetical protein
VTLNLLFAVLALVCFLAVAVFAPDMHGVEEAHRVLAAGLAFLAAAGIGGDRRIG